jgi:hypothetical protein
MIDSRARRAPVKMGEGIMDNVRSEGGGEKIDARLPYDVPELVDHGNVSDITQTGATIPGADGLYS